MKLNRRKLRKMILNEMFGMAQPRGEQELEASASAIQHCIQLILNSGPTAELPGRAVMRDRLEGLRMGTEQPGRVRSALDYRSQEASAEAASDFGIPHLQLYIRKKAFDMISRMYGI